MSSFHRSQDAAIAPYKPGASPIAVECCPLCGGSSIEALYSDLAHCRQCDHTFAAAELTSQQVVELYDETYFHGEEYYDYPSDQRVIELNFRSRLKVLRSFLDPARHQRLFEVGCAYGFFLQLARPYFESVQGIDVAEAAVRYATEQLGVDAVCCDLLEYDLSGRELDVVCIWDTIEHLARPDLYLKKLTEHMRSGALLAITTGDIGSLNARLRRRKWRLMHPPSHAHYFSRRSLSSFLDRLGFSVVYDRHCGFYRSLGSIAHGVFVQRHGASLPFDLVRRLGIGDCALYLNLYDIMYVIGRKR